MIKKIKNNSFIFNPFSMKKILALAVLALVISPLALANSAEFYVAPDNTPIKGSPGDTITTDVAISNLDLDRDAEFDLALRNYTYNVSEEFNMIPKDISESLVTLRCSVTLLVNLLKTFSFLKRSWIIFPAILIY